MGLGLGSLGSGSGSMLELCIGVDLGYIGVKVIEQGLDGVRASSAWVRLELDKSSEDQS